MASRRLFNAAQQEIKSLPLVTTAAVVFWLRVAGVWKQAVVWIRAGGVWRIANPKINVGGTWK